MSPAKIGRYCLRIVKDNSPVKTGNLKNNAINGKMIKKGVYEIRIDGQIAPYVKYTQMPWSETSPLIWKSVKHPEWNGKHHSFLYNHKGWKPTTPKKNPNEGWIDRSIDGILREICEREHGYVREEK